MDFEALKAAATAFLLHHEGNAVSADDAMRDDLAGLTLFDAPVFAVGAADDPLFAELREPGAVHPEYALPEEWVPGARSVVSFFAPFSARVKEANAVDAKNPADEWLHARAEGEAMLNRLRVFVRDAFITEGYAAVAPMLDSRYRMLERFAPNWSERHTGYVCGLGTFGMSKGLVTEKGVAGRIGSVVTDCPLPVTERLYADRYANCSRCGACAARCPVRCIDPARGMDAAKAHPACSAFLDAIEARPARGKSAKPRYGCGKCQAGVPCQDGIPEGGRQWRQTRA